MNPADNSTSKIQGRLSIWLVKHGLTHRPLGFDYQGIETLQIRSQDWPSLALSLYAYGFNYLRSQCAYDVEPGGLLASVYHLTKVYDDADQPQEVCIKIFCIKKKSSNSICFLDMEKCRFPRT
jgi:NAD(P)H-quinone oxidoreductase subunit J